MLGSVGHPPQLRKHRTHLWKFQVKRRVMSAVPLYSSCFICARLGGLMRHSAPELPSICAVTMSSGLYWLMNCMASCVEHTSVRGSRPPFSCQPTLYQVDTVQATYWVGVKLLGQLLVVLGRERHYRWLLGTHGEQWLGMRCMISMEPSVVHKEWV